MHNEVKVISMLPAYSIAAVCAGSAAFIGVLLVLYFLLRHNSSTNPFTEAFVREPEEILINQKRRDQILKQGFRADKVPKNLDAIVIGSGLGGLTCAGCLARSGKRVLVLEQHDRAGGCTHTYEEKGFEFDIGLHYIGQVHHGSICHTMFDILSDGQLVWEELNKEFDTVAIRQQDKSFRNFTYMSGKGDYERRLIELFPEEEAAVLEFVKLIRKSSKSLLGFVMLKVLPKWLLRFMVATNLYQWFNKGYNELANVSVKEVVDRLTDNEELKTVLTYCFGDYGTVPSQAPFYMHGVLMYHFYHGCYYPRGGASELALTMIPGITRSGGAVLVRASVSRIIFKNDRAVGVCVDKSGKEHEIFAPIIISNAGTFNTYDKLIPPSITSQLGLRRHRKKLKTGFSGMQVLVGLRGSAEELSLPLQNFWVFGASSDIESEMTKYLSLSREEAANEDVPLLFVSFPSTKDSTWPARHPGKSVCVIVTFANWEWFKEWDDERVMKRGKVYDDLKLAFQEQVWNQILELFPQFKDKVEYIETGTPVTHSYYIAAPRGEYYGADHNMKRFGYDVAMDLRPKTTIPGLYLTGQDVMSAGITGAAIGGMMTASSILQRNLMNDLTVVCKKRKRQNERRNKKTQ